VTAVGGGVVSVAAAGGTVGAVVVTGGTVNVKQVCYPAYMGPVDIVSTNAYFFFNFSSD